MLSTTFDPGLLIISLETTCWSNSTSFNMAWTLSRLSVMFPYQSIMIYSIFVYVYDHGFHLLSDFIRYISSVTSRITIDGLDFNNYYNTPCRNNVMQISNLGKYMLWSSTDVSVGWIFLYPWPPDLLLSWWMEELGFCTWLVLIGHSWAWVSTLFTCLDTFIELPHILLINSP